MPDARDVYANEPGAYDALVSCEDYQQNVVSEIRRLVALDGADVVEFGAGTGRVTAWLAPYVRSIRAFDNAPRMVELARHKLGLLGAVHCVVEGAENTQIPAADGSADVAVAGWTFGHQTSWTPDGWQTPIRGALAEMFRVLRPGGTALVIETLGTGYEQPFTPAPALGAYYDMLERDYGFTRRWVRSDYRFSSLPEGERLLGGFFSAGHVQKFLERQSCVYPECTGLWVLRTA